MEKGSTMTIVIGQPCNLDYVIYFYEPIRQVITVCFENLPQKDKNACNMQMNVNQIECDY